jgi:hypothetical protein
MMRRLRTADDIEKLEGHVTKVDPLANPLNRIIEHYYIHPFYIKCGLAGCGQSHMEGCLVELADLSITNIGHVCGARFGERFELEKRKNYDTEYKPRLIQSITQAQAKLAADQLKLHEASLLARDHGQRINDLTRMFPGLVENLRRRAFGNTAKVNESVERTKEEIDDLMAANRFQNRDELGFKEQYVGTISGFRFPSYDWSMSSGLRKLFHDLTKFYELKPRSLPMSDLQRWAHWAEDFDENLARTMIGIEDGNNFFTVPNFQLFAVLTPSDAMKARLRTLKVSDICAPLAAPSNLPRPSSTPKRGLGGGISPRELRRLTGNKKAR